jgi:hypothetical protein
VASRQPPTAVSQTREEARGAPVRTGPPSKTVQPTMLSATAISLSSPYFARFASSRVPEDRGVGSSILPLTTSEFGPVDHPTGPNSCFGPESSTGRRAKFVPRGVSR